MTERESIEGTWRLDGVYHVMFRMVRSGANHYEFWYGTHCGHTSPTLVYDFEARALTAKMGIPFKEPRAYRRDPTCLTCIVVEASGG